MKRLIWVLCLWSCGSPDGFADLKPSIEVAPQELRIEASPWGATAAAEFTIANRGNFRLVVEAIKLDGGDPGFSVEGPTSTTLAPAAELKVLVRYAKSLRERAETRLIIASNDPDRPEIIVPVIAVISAAPQLEGLCASPDPVEFGTVAAGESSERTVRLSNCGTAPIEITDVYAAGSGFSVPEMALPVQLMPGDGRSWSVPVRFAPSAAGEFVGALRASTADRSAAIQLVGRSNECILAADNSPLLMTAKLGGESLQRVEFENIGQKSCTIERITLDAAELFVDGESSFELLPGDRRSITVAYRPRDLIEDRATLRLLDDDGALLVVDVTGTPENTPCEYTLSPADVDFGEVTVGDFRATSVLFTRVDGTCVILGAQTEGDFHIDTDFPIVINESEQTKSLPLRFNPSAAGAQEVSLTVTTNVGADDLRIAGTGVERTLCIDPQHLAFGEVSTDAERVITLTACGDRSVTVSDIGFAMTDAEFSVDAVQLPVELSTGESAQITVRYQPTDDESDTAVLEFVASDALAPSVRITGGPEIVPPESGAYLYFWRIDPPAHGQAPDVNSDVVRVPLQGAPVVEAVRGPSAPSANKCSGCHSLSPDGRFLAVIDGWYEDEHHFHMQLSIVDTNTKAVVVPQIQDVSFVSWRPDVTTDPPYQFAYAQGGDIRTGSIFGDIGAVEGASSSEFLETMPTWGADGNIAFVRHSGTGDDLHVYGPTELLRVPETGGEPTQLADGQHENALLYYPRYSPNGRFIAFTRSTNLLYPSFANPDAQIQMLATESSEPVSTANLNVVGAANSYPTWSPDGGFLSFGSDRAGGAGSFDLYLTPVDEDGTTGAPTNLSNVNTAAFEHAAEWSR